MLRSIILGSLAAVATASPTAWSVGQDVKTSSGTVTGHAGTFRKEVSEYLGIPYAKPPVGELRFASPVKFTGSGSINGSTYSPDCSANFESPMLATGLDNANPSGVLYLTEMMQLGHEPREDCLTVNVWTKPQAGEKKKAVMLWIYGGGFNTGNSANKIYNGQYLAENQDVVVVSFNYRLNIFGFPGVPGVAGVAQNPGLEDQRVAVEWVRDNIEAFGGDVNRITLFGESAGGASVDFYNYAWEKDPIIHASIAESGSVTSFANPNPNDNLEWWKDAATKLKCPVDDLTASVKCMRGKTTKEILDVTVIENPLIEVLGHFGPNVDKKVVFGDYVARAKAGQFIKKPYMAGNNHFEAGLFVMISNAANIKLPANIWGIFNAAVFTCPTARLADARSNAGLLTYRYRYFGDWANTNLIPGSGAYHTSEIPMIFGTNEEATGGAANEPQQQKISDYMQKVWASFAKDPESLSKAPLNLPKYNPKTAYTDSTLLGFGANNQTIEMLLPSTYDSYCETISDIMKDIPGGITGAIFRAAEGKDMGIPGLTMEQLPDMSPPELAPLSA